MTHPVAILLPGLDGSGQLFERFIAVAPPTLPVRVQPLPSDRPRVYSDLVDALLPRLPKERLALIAESFSGPLAILLANRCPRISAVVLCATFVLPPLPSLFSRLPAFMWRKPPPRLLLQHFLTGGDLALAADVRAHVAMLDRAVLRARVHAALTVDVRQELARLAQPVLYLRAERDRIVPARCASAVRAACPSAQVSTVDGPHLILQARPEESWRRIAAFLGDARRIASS